MKAALKVKAAPEESLRGGAVCSGSAELIVALRQQIHALEELVVEDEGPNDDHGAQDAPEPEGGSAEGIVHIAAGQLINNLI